MTTTRGMEEEGKKWSIVNGRTSEGGKEGGREGGRESTQGKEGQRRG